MDAYQQSHRYTRPPLPPLPSMADPNQHHHHNQFAPPPRQQVHPQSPWYPGQFQYHPPSSSSSSPPPPPPHLHQQPQQQWAPPPHSDQYPPPAYPPPHHHPVPPYPAHQPPHNQFPPPPRPHVLPLPPPHNQPYPQVNQEWGSMNWAHQQGWEYPVHSNEEDWAARARAWATAKAAMDYQHPQSQFTPTGRPEEQIQYYDQHVQAVDSHYPQSQQQQAHPAPGYLQFQAAPTHRSPGVHLQESGSMSSGPASFVPDGHSSYAARDGALAGDSNAAFPHQENMSASSTVHQQEVPSSYSSVTGISGAGDQNDQLYKSLPLDVTSQEGQHHVQSSMPAVGRSDLMDHSFAYGNHLADPPADLSDQPLDFAPRFNRGHESHMQSSFPQPDSVGPIRGMDPGAVMPSIHAWPAPVAQGIAYPPISPVLPAGPQHDPSLPGHATPLGRIPGPGFQPTVPSSAPFGLGAGPAVHATAAYPGDAYGVPGMSDRPKKVAVPNWLREEIIKKKAVIASSAHEQPNEETQSIEDEAFEKTLGKGDQADSKSIDSSRSTEEEDDDEDYVEAARTAAINQEIKRILTEVLLKVTDELFDEIATKVLSEDDLMVEVDQDTKASNQRASVSPPAVPTPKPSAKVLIPLKSKESESRDASEKSTSSSRADVLGLGSYASDDDDDEIQTSDLPNSRENTGNKQLSMKKDSEVVHEIGENGSSQPEIEEHDKHQAHSGDVSNKSAVVSELKHGNAVKAYSSELSSEVTEGNVGRKVLDGINKSEFKHGVGEKVVKKPEPPGEDVNAEKLKSEYSQSRESGIKSEKNGGYETQRNSTGKDSIKEVGSGKIKADGKVDENHVKQEERYLGKTKAGNGSKERKKGEGARPEGKVKESDSKTRSIHLNGEEDSKETERGKRHSAKEDSGKKREMVKDEKEDRSKHKLQSDSSRHKRRRSPSPGRRGRHSKNDAVVSHANDTSDEASEDSRRKVHEKRRNLSPSPVKSRRRQLSRSPHSKHSQRRHSPYSSLETTRKRRSRSRSPIRRQR